jgi:hypothetical protein
MGKQTSSSGHAGAVVAVDAFKRALADVDGNVLRWRELGRTVNAACDGLVASLRAVDPTDEATIDYVARETRPLFCSSALFERAYTKPRGYAGDYLTIEHYYEDVARGADLSGALIDRWLLSLPASRAVKNRRGLLAARIREASAGKRARVTSLACGPCREIFDVLIDERVSATTFTCIDNDNEAIAFVREKAERTGVANRMTLVHDNVVRIACGKRSHVLEPQDLIYSVGLTDYLADEYVITLLNWAHAQLAPGGAMLLGNFDIANPDKVLMDSLVDWRLIHRSRDDLKRLFQCSRFASAEVEIFTEGENVNSFAMARRG